MNIVIIGHTVGVRFCIEEIKKTTHQVKSIFTHEKSLHTHDLRLFEKRKAQFGSFAYNVFDAQEDFGIPVLEYTDISGRETIESIRAYEPDVIVTVGCRDILKKDFIESFKYVINLHPFHLPYFRGAGIDSWMILQGYSGSMQQATCHFINPKIDAGNIICTEPYFIPDNATPLDIFKVRISKLGILLNNALNKLESGTVGVTQDNSSSRYFPRLFTPRDGKVDFLNWSGPEIERFVRAFSYPYDGAFASYEDGNIHFMGARFNESGMPHPFSFGLIFAKSENHICVYCQNGYLELSGIEVDGIAFDLSKVKLGRFLR